MRLPSFKDTVLTLHRWLGLTSGIVVLVLSVTGCLFVFQQEISGWYRHDLHTVDRYNESRTPLPVDTLQARAQQALGVERLPYGLTSYREADRNWTALLYTYQPGSWTYMGMSEEYKTLYLNPYTGEVEGIHNEKKDFFQIVKGIHWSLLLATPIGQPIVVWSTVIFLVMLVSGMVLWWPKRWDKAGRRRSFTIKWGSTWRRVNYDLHNVLGFWFLTLALLMGLTGLYWYFPSAKKTLHFLGTGEYRLPAQPQPKAIALSSEADDSTAAAGSEVRSPLQEAYRQAWNEYPRAWSIALAAPAPGDSAGLIHATVRPDGETYYANSELYFDPRSGNRVSAHRYADQSAGEKLMSMNYDIHVGAIGGLPGKILAFLGSLVCASLPVTGFIIWWDRRKRKAASGERNAKRGARRAGRPPDARRGSSEESGKSRRAEPALWEN